VTPREPVGSGKEMLNKFCCQRSDPNPPLSEVNFKTMAVGISGNPDSSIMSFTYFMNSCTYHLDGYEVAEVCPR
jgi:hypothetical protein